jgi:hypothetical protein
MLRLSLCPTSAAVICYRLHFYSSRFFSLLFTNRFLLNLAAMTKKQATSGNKKSGRRLLKELLRSFSRGHSRAPSSATSPVPGKAMADDALSTTTTSALALEMRLDHKLDDELDDWQDADQDAATVMSQDQANENSGPDAADLTREYDTWKIAEIQLRQDKKKRKLLDAYYDILKSKLNEKLEPAGTPERKRQISAFIDSESKNIQNTNHLGVMGQVLKQAFSFMVRSMDVTAASARCFPASIACAGMVLILSVSWTSTLD